MTTAEKPTPASMRQQLAPRTPDGTRRLTAKWSHEFRQGQSAATAFDCHIARISAHQGTEPPESCQRVIEPGRFFAFYEPIHPTTKQRGLKYRYCAPCAAREWPHKLIREVPA